MVDMNQLQQLLEVAKTNGLELLFDFGWLAGWRMHVLTKAEPSRAAQLRCYARKKPAQL